MNSIENPTYNQLKPNKMVIQLEDSQVQIIVESGSQPLHKINTIPELPQEGGYRHCIHTGSVSMLPRGLTWKRLSTISQHRLKVNLKV
uniref:Uncharacterized protein n=1 Tax=Nelumbo nucifera TaxID=4432 RepID=A0A822XNR4_NELNU|nr:TPA_asm: hypothetical protein HUJ06_021858 [Nelumbo nucifera]